MTTASHCDTEKPAESHLDEEVPKLQVTQDLMHNLQALGIGNQGVKLPGNVKVLGTGKAVSNSAPPVWLQQYSFSSSVKCSLLTKSNRNGV